MIDESTSIMKISLPEDWSVHRFDEISEFDKKTVDPLKKPDQLYNYITISDIQDYRITSYQELIGKEAPSRARKKVVDGDILVSTVRPYLKAFAKIDERYENFICSTGFSVISPKEKVLSDYLYYLIQTDQFTNELMKRMVGATYPAVTSSDIKHLKIPVPPLVEQRGIVEVLGTVDECIRLTDAVIERAEELKRGLMHQLLTRGMGHTEYKETSLGEIPKTWKVGYLGDVVEIHDKKRIPLKEEERNKIRGEYPYCGANGIIDYINQYLFDGEYVLLAEDGGHWGRFENSSYIMIGKFWVNNHAHILLAKKGKANNHFIKYILNYLELSSYITGSTRGKLNQKELRSIRLPVPPIDEQNKISQILLTLEEKIKSESNIKRHLMEIKTGLMQVLFTGKIRVELKGDGLHRIGDSREANNCMA